MQNLLKAQTRLISENANRKLEDYLCSVTSNASNDPKILTEERLLAAIKMLKSHDLVSQKYLINLLAVIGFNVMINEYVEAPMVFLPKEYQQAMQELKKEKE